MESGTAHLVHLFAYELQVPVVCVLVYSDAYFDLFFEAYYEIIRCARTPVVFLQ